VNSLVKGISRTKALSCLPRGFETISGPSGPCKWSCGARSLFLNRVNRSRPSCSPCNFSTLPNITQHRPLLHILLNLETWIELLQRFGYVLSIFRLPFASSGTPPGLLAVESSTQARVSGTLAQHLRDRKQLTAAFSPLHLLSDCDFAPDGGESTNRVRYVLCLLSVDCPR